MDQPSLKALLFDRPDLYPKILAERFPRILANIESRLGSNELGRYLRDLKFNDRGDRQGFPPEVLVELMELEQLNDRLVGEFGSREVEPWEEEAAGKQLAPEAPKPMSLAFAKALESGDMEGVKNHLAMGQSVAHVNDTGWTPLMIAAFNGNLALVDFLLARRADVNALDPRSQTAAHLAAFAGQGVVLDLLYESGNIRNRRSSTGATPLIVAAAQAQSEIVKQLLGLGEHPNAMDLRLWTALHHAADKGSSRTVMHLLFAGADPLMKTESGETPRDIAQSRGAAQVVRLISAAMDAASAGGSLSPSTTAGR